MDVLRVPVPPPPLDTIFSGSFIASEALSEQEDWAIIIEQ